MKKKNWKKKKMMKIVNIMKMKKMKIMMNMEVFPKESHLIRDLVL